MMNNIDEDILQKFVSKIIIPKELMPESGYGKLKICFEKGKIVNVSRTSNHKLKKVS